MTQGQHANPANDLPDGLAAPARRALNSAGIHRLEQLSEVRESELRQMHGIGPRAVELLRAALQARGLSFAREE